VPARALADAGAPVRLSPRTGGGRCFECVPLAEFVRRRKTHGHKRHCAREARCAKAEKGKCDVKNRPFRDQTRLSQATYFPQ